MYISKTKEIYSLIIVYLASSQLDMPSYRKRYSGICNETTFKNLQFDNQFVPIHFVRFFFHHLIQIST